MAFLDRKHRFGSHNEDGEPMITLRFSIENSIRFIVYVSIENQFIKKRNINNLNKLIKLINVETSYEEEDVEARQYFLLLKEITQIMIKEELSNLDVLQDQLITEHGDKDISSDIIYHAMDMIDEAIAGEFILGENEVLEMNNFVETRLSFSFLNENLDRMRSVTRDLAEGRTSDSKIVEEASELISNLHTQLTKTKTASNIEDNTINFASRDESEGTIERYVDKHRSPENKLKTGFKGLNQMLNGGLQEGRLYIFLGTPKSFKSGTLLNVALSVAQHNEISELKSRNRKPVVLYYSMENDSIETLDRIFFYYFGMGIAESNLSRSEITEAIYQATNFDTGIGIIVKYAPSNSVDTDHLYDTMDELREDGFETILLVQDYLRRIRPKRQSIENRLILGHVADELSIIAKTENIPVISASQLNREATNIRENAIKSNTMDIASQMYISHIAESVQIQENMDYGIIVAREEVVKFDEMGSKSSKSYIGFKLVASRDRQTEDVDGNKLEYLAYPFENGFKIAQDEGTDEVLWSESVARASMTDEEYTEMEERRKNIKDKMDKSYKDRGTGNNIRIPNARSTNRTSIGRSTANINNDVVRQKLNKYDPMNDI